MKFQSNTDIIPLWFVSRFPHSFPFLSSCYSSHGRCRLQCFNRDPHWWVVRLVPRWSEWYWKRDQYDKRKHNNPHILNISGRKSMQIFNLKVTSNNFTHSRVFTGLGEWCCKCEKSNIKPFVDPEEVAWNLINAPSDVTQWQRFNVGNVGF